MVGAGVWYRSQVHIYRPSPSNLCGYTLRLHNLRSGEGLGQRRPRERGKLQVHVLLTMQYRSYTLSFDPLLRCAV